jgi:polyhydroxybutyrate depolymerase
MIVFGVLLLLAVLAFAGYRLTRPVERKPLERYVESGGMSRRYRAWMPPSRGDHALPVVLAFHPGMGAAEGFEQQVALHEAGEAANFVIVYPEGYQRSWNAGTCCGAALRDKIDEVGFVHAILDDLEAVAAIDRRRVYATGLSNGARLCYYLACMMSDEITAIAPIAGTVQGPEVERQPTRPVPIFHLHGLADRWVPYRGGQSVWKNAGISKPVERELEFWRRLAKTSAISHATLFDGAGDCVVHSAQNGTEIRLCRIAGLGHHWPGARLVGRYREIAHMFGPTLSEIDLDQVNNEILRFFAQYALPERTASDVAAAPRPAPVRAVRPAR